MRTLKLIGAAAAVLVLAALGTVYGLLRASLPQLDGRVHLPGLNAPVSIARDALGVPTIEARDRADLAYATGFVHGQDRFFQMDLARRLAAGELSELFGPVAVDQDRKTRLFRFRTVARAVVAAATPAQRAVVEAYARGVNAGLASLGARPWEYWVLGQAPAA
ncbi:MAG TPA: penicillin acylase family protein, partial [Steroidobacteraceae bacterium]